MLGYVWPATMPNSRTPCKATSTCAHGWATMNIDKSNTSKIKVIFQEGCATTTTTTIIINNSNSNSNSNSNANHEHNNNDHNNTNNNNNNTTSTTNNNNN